MQPHRPLLPAARLAPQHGGPGGGRGLPGPRTQSGRRLGAGVLPPPHPQEEGKGNKRSPRGGAAGQRLALTAHLCAHPRPQLQVTEPGQGGWPKGSRISLFVGGPAGDREVSF